MKNQVMRTIAVLALFATLAAGSAWAQGADVVKVSVLFDFAVSGKTLPAGEYFVKRSIEGRRVLLRIWGEGTNVDLYLSTLPVKARDIQQESKLVFNKYGDHYFLSQVWTAGRADGEGLAKTRKEYSLQREMAKRTGEAETISIAAGSK